MPYAYIPFATFGPIQRWAGRCVQGILICLFIRLGSSQHLPSRFPPPPTPTALVDRTENRRPRLDLSIGVFLVTYLLNVSLRHGSIRLLFQKPNLADVLEIPLVPVYHVVQVPAFVGRSSVRSLIGHQLLYFRIFGFFQHSLTRTQLTFPAECGSWLGRPSV